MEDVFSDRLEAWRAYVHSPWGRLRYALVQQILQREAVGLGAKLRVLDVGGGDGRDALPLALAGHEVTIVDQSPAWLVEAERRAHKAGAQVRTRTGDLTSLPALGEFDLVLCHFVLQYRADHAGDLAELVPRVRPGGKLSVIVPNPAGMVLRSLVTDGPAAALAELRSESRLSVTFDHQARKIHLDELEDAMHQAGFGNLRRYGIRTANDLLPVDGPKHEAAYFAQLLELELALCDREPFVRVGAAYQLIGRRNAVKAASELRGNGL